MRPILFSLWALVFLGALYALVFQPVEAPLLSILLSGVLLALALDLWAREGNS